LGRFDIPAGPSGHERAAFHYLSTSEQARGRAQAGELLFLPAALAPLQVHPHLRNPRREDLPRRPCERTGQAGSCYEDANTPGALWQQRAVLAQLLGREDEARQLLARAAQTTPRGPRDCSLLACIHMADGRFRQALPLWQRASQEDPQNVW